ncbi:hypothetical protein RRG08_013846 [Elysia crispata]|uniref:Transmembrane protein n=1 Tax=Elysia crispata TaxID=231223 RepID=A0AAE1DM03_9GAST|nr:hypothetical protein RRG08_013846 [Elysia crispata]
MTTGHLSSSSSSLENHNFVSRTVQWSRTWLSQHRTRWLSFQLVSAQRLEGAEFTSNLQTTITTTKAVTFTAILTTIIFIFTFDINKTFRESKQCNSNYKIKSECRHFLAELSP